MKKLFGPRRGRGLPSTSAGPFTFPTPGCGGWGVPFALPSEVYLCACSLNAGRVRTLEGKFNHTGLSLLQGPRKGRPIQQNELSPLCGLGDNSAYANHGSVFLLEHGTALTSLTPVLPLLHVCWTVPPGHLLPSHPPAGNTVLILGADIWALWALAPYPSLLSCPHSAPPPLFAPPSLGPSAASPLHRHAHHGHPHT